MATDEQTPLSDGSAGRAGARRTALIVGLIAIAVYVGFILSGVIGR